MGGFARAVSGGRGPRGCRAGAGLSPASPGLFRASCLWHPAGVPSFRRLPAAWTLLAAGLLGACEERLEIELRYPDEGVYQRHSLRDRALDGWSEVRYPDGVVESEGSWRDGLREGPWIMRHPGGALRSRGAYREGLREGEWEEWREDGSLVERGTWRSGARDGVFEIGVPEGGGRMSAVWERGSLLRFEPRP